MDWIKLTKGEYAHVNGIYTAMRGYTRAYGDNTWSLYGADKPRKFPSFKELQRVVALLIK